MCDDVARGQHLRSASCHQLFVPRHRRSVFDRPVFCDRSDDVELVTRQYSSIRNRIGESMLLRVEIACRRCRDAAT